MPVDLAQNEALRRRLRATLPVARTRAQGAYEVVVTCNEVNDRHGTGILVQSLFPSDSVLFLDESRPADEEVARCMEWIRQHPEERAQLTAGLIES